MTFSTSDSHSRVSTNHCPLPHSSLAYRRTKTCSVCRSSSSTTWPSLGVEVAATRRLGDPATRSLGDHVDATASVRASTTGGLLMVASGSILGNAVRRLEDPELLTGAGKYVDDLVEPNMAHIAFVRSTVAHANL